MIVNGTGVKETTEARAHLVTGVQKLTLPDRYGPDFIRPIFLLPLFHRSRRSFFQHRTRFGFDGASGASLGEP